MSASPPQHVARDERDEHREVQRERGDDAQDRDGEEDLRSPADVAQAFDQLVDHGVPVALDRRPAPSAGGARWRASGSRPIDHRHVADGVDEEQRMQADRRDRQAGDGRADDPRDVEQALFSATALAMSSRPTISTTNAWRTGMSNALTTPSSSASTKTCHTCTWPVTTSTPRTSARRPAAIWVTISAVLLRNGVGDDAAEQPEEQHRRELRRGDQAQRRAGRWSAAERATPGQPAASTCR